jgi:hypothetical protein
MDRNRDEILAEQINVISSLNGEQLQAWLTARCEQRDAILPDDPDFDAAYPVVALSPHLSAAVRAQLQYACVSLLTNWLSSHSQFDDPIDNLLLVIQGLNIKPAGPRLEIFVRSDDFAAASERLQDRILQTLVALEMNLAPHFWHTLVAIDPQRFAGVAFDGLSLVSPNHAVDLLTKLPTSTAIAESISLSLPGFIDNIFPAKSRWAVRSLIAARIWQFPAPIAQVVKTFFQKEQTPVSGGGIVRHWRASKILVTREAYPALVETQKGSSDKGRALPEGNPARILLTLAHQ